MRPLMKVASCYFFLFGAIFCLAGACQHESALWLALALAFTALASPLLDGLGNERNKRDIEDAVDELCGGPMK